MFAKWSARNPVSGTAYNHFQGHALAQAEVEQPRVMLFVVDLPAFIFQSGGGMNQGDGRFSMFGLARETALLHIRCQVFVHFYSG